MYISFLFSLLYHISKQSNNGNEAISEHSTRNKPNFTLGLAKRSGRPEQWPKTSLKYDLIRRIWPFLGHLDEFGENWIEIWMNC